MKTRSLVLLFLIFLTSGRAEAVCGQPPEARGTTLLLRGAVVACRSALPEIEALLNARREAHEQRVQPLRDRIPNSDRLWSLRPYEEIVADHLARVAGVIVTFELDGLARIPAGFDTRKESSGPVWRALDRIERREIFLRLDGGSCDLLSEPPPTVLVQEFVCCDVRPSSNDSCMLELTEASLPPDDLLAAQETRNQDNPYRASGQPGRHPGGALQQH